MGWRGRRVGRETVREGNGLGEGNGFGEGDGLGKGDGFGEGDEFRKEGREGKGGEGGEERGGEGKGRDGKRKQGDGTERKEGGRQNLAIYAYVSADRQTDTQTHRHTKVKTVYPPVSLRSLGGYNYGRYDPLRLTTLSSFSGLQICAITIYTSFNCYNYLTIYL